MKRYFALATILLCAAPAFADAGGEPINTDCNGIGNPNSYCDGSEGIDNPPPPPVCEEPTTPPAASTGVCLTPLDAAHQYLAIDFDFSGPKAACEKQCKAIANACSVVARGNNTCFQGIIKGTRKFARYNCDAISETAARHACLVTIQSYSKRSSATLRRNADAAQVVCRQSVTACEAACQ